VAQCGLAWPGPKLAGRLDHGRVGAASSAGESLDHAGVDLASSRGRFAATTVVVAMVGLFLAQCRLGI